MIRYQAADTKGYLADWVKSLEDDDDEDYLTDIEEWCKSSNGKRVKGAKVSFISRMVFITVVLIELLSVQ